MTEWTLKLLKSFVWPARKICLPHQAAEKTEINFTQSGTTVSSRHSYCTCYWPYEDINDWPPSTYAMLNCRIELQLWPLPRHGLEWAFELVQAHQHELVPPISSWSIDENGPCPSRLLWWEALLFWNSRSKNNMIPPSGLISWCAMVSACPQLPIISRRRLPSLWSHAIHRLKQNHWVLNYTCPTSGYQLSWTSSWDILVYRSHLKVQLQAWDPMDKLFVPWDVNPRLEIVP